MRSVRSESRLSFIPPLIPTLVDKPPTGPGWIHEIKQDGYRMQLLVEGGIGRLLTRRGLDWTKKFSQITAAATRLRCRSGIVDGETVVQRENGVSDLAALTATARRSSSPSTSYTSMARISASCRSSNGRGRLGELLASIDGAIGFSDAFEGSGSELFAAAERMGLEGIVSKKATSGYRGGPSKAWLKTKCWTESELTLIGFDKDSKGTDCAPCSRVCRRPGVCRSRACGSAEGSTRSRRCAVADCPTTRP